MACCACHVAVSHHYGIDCNNDAVLGEFSRIYRLLSQWTHPASARHSNHPRLPHPHHSTWLMMTSCHGNALLITGHLCGEFNGIFPSKKASNAELWCFLCCQLNKLLNIRRVGDLKTSWRSCEVTVMLLLFHLCPQASFVMSETTRSPIPNPHKPLAATHPSPMSEPPNCIIDQGFRFCITNAELNATSNYWLLISIRK